MIYDAGRVNVFHCSIGAIELTETEWGQLTLILQTSRPTNNAEVWAKSRTKDLRKRIPISFPPPPPTNPINKFGRMDPEFFPSFNIV